MCPKKYILAKPIFRGKIKTIQIFRVDFLKFFLLPLFPFTMLTFLLIVPFRLEKDAFYVIHGRNYKSQHNTNTSSLS